MPDVHTVTSDPTDTQREEVEQRILAFLIPNMPRTTEDGAIVTKAAVLQWQHEQSNIKTLDGAVLPDGVTGFHIGNFSMSFDSGLGGVLSRSTICPTAYAMLLNAGLLYRGVSTC